MDMNKGKITLSAKARLRAALAVAIAADLLQIAVFPLFVEGAASPADDVLDVAVAGILSYLLGWHWEFLPSFLVKLAPGIDFIPLWTMAVGNVYRKTGHAEADPKGNVVEGRIIDGEPVARASR